MLGRELKVGEYVLLEKLGAGGFGEVWKAEKRTELSTSHFALKFFQPKDDSIGLEGIKREIETWQKLNGLPNIISVIEANRFEGFVYVVSEFADGGSLEKWLRANGGKADTFEEAVKITCQILCGLEGMHKEGFVHRDLKPANVLLKRGIFYLADFGISRRMKTYSRTNSTAGTYEFMPPEAFDKNPAVSVHTDIWAVGVILQVLLTGHSPFPQDEIPSLITSILMSEPEPMPVSVPENLRAIVKKALQKNREDRFQTAGQMYEALQDSLTRQKFSGSQIETQTELITFKTPDKTAKLEIPPTEYRQEEVMTQPGLSDTSRLPHPIRKKKNEEIEEARKKQANAIKRGIFVWIAILLLLPFIIALILAKPWELFY